MLGLRGVRPALVVPGLFDLQVRAIAEATAQLIKMGRDPQPEFMIPLVGSVQELEIIRADSVKVLGEGGRRYRGGLPGADRHDDRAAAGGDDRRADRGGGGVLLLRHQRPEPQTTWVSPATTWRPCRPPLTYLEQQISRALAVRDP